MHNFQTRILNNHQWFSEHKRRLAKFLILDNNQTDPTFTDPWSVTERMTTNMKIVSLKHPSQI